MKDMCKFVAIIVLLIALFVGIYYIVQDNVSFMLVVWSSGALLSVIFYVLAIILDKQDVIISKLEDLNNGNKE